MGDGRYGGKTDGARDLRFTVVDGRYGNFAGGVMLLLRLLLWLLAVDG